MENSNPPGLTILPIPLETERHYTIYGVSETAIAIRREIRVIDVLPTPELRSAYSGSSKGKWRLGTFKEGRRRAAYHFDVNVAGTLIIPGTLHGVPADHEKWSSWSMSATINLAATPERIREIVNPNINPNFVHHDRIVAYPTPLNRGGGETGILVYPDAPTSHAVILRMRETLTRGDA
jgi:hypothetical protein